MLQAELPSTNGWSLAELALVHSLRYGVTDMTALIPAQLLVLAAAITKVLHFKT